MSSRVIKTSRARLAVLAIGAGVLSSFAISAAPAMAASPNGANCNPTDGKISGRGSTFQASAISTFTSEYENDVCGVVPTQYSGDPAGNTMVAYNYAGNAGTGSGAGQKAASCRSDAFGGTDLPYTETLLHTQLNSTAGATGGCPTTASPFTPGTPYPNASDKATAAMVFPIAGGATAIGYNLGPATCPTGFTGPLNLTSTEMDKIWQGTINQWNDATLIANNPGLQNCSGPINRVVRADNSGTTSQFKTYLGHIDSSNTCGTPGTTWNGTGGLNTAPNTTWPTGCTDSNNNTANNPVVPPSSGTPALISCVEGTESPVETGCGDGSIGYGELGIWGSQAPSATLASLQTAASASGTPVYITPGSGTSGSNCSFLSLGGLPGSKSANDAVSLNGTPKGSGSANWASDATTNKSDFTYQGSNYPICGLTFDIVYSNLHTIGGTSDPFIGLTADQRETLYTFFSYAVTTEGQNGLTSAGYDPLPALWDGTIRQGIQQNF